MIQVSTEIAPTDGRLHVAAFTDRGRESTPCAIASPRALAASQGDIVFIQLGEIVLAIYPRDLLAEDAATSPNGSGFSGIALAYNTRSREEVSSILEIAQAAGGVIVKPARDVFWGGHSGCFSDPDGILWEVAWNPHFILNEDGKIALP